MIFFSFASKKNVSDVPIFISFFFYFMLISDSILLKKCFWQHHLFIFIISSFLTNDITNKQIFFFC